MHTCKVVSPHTTAFYQCVKKAGKMEEIGGFQAAANRQSVTLRGQVIIL